MQNMDDKEISELFDSIAAHYEKYLQKFGVKPISLKILRNQTKDALVLLYLARSYLNTKVVSKEELTEFMKSFYPHINAMQQARYLGKQKGYNIVSIT